MESRPYSMFMEMLLCSFHLQGRSHRKLLLESIQQLMFPTEKTIGIEEVIAVGYGT